MCNAITGERCASVARGALNCNHHDEVLLGAAVHGTGIVLLPGFMAEASVTRGEPQRLLPEWSPRPLLLHLVYESRHKQPLCVRKLIDHLVVSLAPATSAVAHAPLLLRGAADASPARPQPGAAATLAA